MVKMDEKNTNQSTENRAPFAQDKFLFLLLVFVVVSCPTAPVETENEV